MIFILLTGIRIVYEVRNFGDNKFSSNCWGGGLLAGHLPMNFKRGYGERNEARGDDQCRSKNISNS
jgi:hypothetical protein